MVRVMGDLWGQMASEPWLLLSVLLCVGVILVNGATDAPNAIATCVVTRALSVRAAVWLSCVFNFLGVLVMSLVNATVSETVCELADFGTGRQAVLAMSAAMSAIVLWATLAWRFGIPTSESHALLAGLSGASVAMHHGLSGLSAAAWGRVLTGLAWSVVLGFVGGFWLCRLIAVLCRRRRRTRANRALGRAEIVGAATMSFMHGAQDGQKFLGIFLLLRALAVGKAFPKGEAPPLSLLLVCAGLMAVGTALGGKRIIRAIGRDMIRPERYQGLAADLGAALPLFFGSCLGIPLSTTHVKSTALMGAGAARRPSSVRWHVVWQIVVAWLLTFPGCGFLGYGMTRLFLLF